MKITEDHYKHLLEHMRTRFPSKETVMAFRHKLKQDVRVKNIETRLRWDILYKAVPSKWIVDELYPYLNDDHIDTALKRIMLELEK